MRILLAFRGNLGPLVNERGSVPADVNSRGTSHASEVNALLVSHWLREDHGCEIDWLTERQGGRRDWHFRPVTIGEVGDGSWYDVILVWKIHGWDLAARVGLWDRVAPSVPVATWFDAPGLLRKVEGPAHRIRLVMWGTDALRRDEQDNFPRAAHSVVEHAVGFDASRVDTTYRRGEVMYMGRLPAPYLRAVTSCASLRPVRAFALWAPDRNGRKLNLRPKDASDNLAHAREVMRKASTHVELLPAVNIGADYGQLQGHLCGLCPSTRARPAQKLSASKFYDYAALGLPLLLASNTPEARHLSCPGDAWRGELFEMDNSASLQRAMRRMLARSRDQRFDEDRRQLRAWALAHHTYRHRAREIHHATASTNA